MCFMFSFIEFHKAFLTFPSPGIEEPEIFNPANELKPLLSLSNTFNISESDYLDLNPGSRSMIYVSSVSPT